MPKENIENEYTVKGQSFLKFLLINWRVWLIFIFIVICFFYTGKKLHKENYFGQEIVSTYQKDVIVKQTRKTPHTTALVINPLDNVPFRLYEVNLGLNCILKDDKDIEGHSFPMIVELHKRNYNNTYFLRFPDIQTHVCVARKINTSTEKPQETIMELEEKEDNPEDVNEETVLGAN